MEKSDVFLKIPPGGVADSREFRYAGALVGLNQSGIALSCLQMLKEIRDLVNSLYQSTPQSIVETSVREPSSLINTSSLSSSCSLPA